MSEGRPARSFRLDGRMAFVSGGAGHLGAAMVRALAAEGAHVIVNGRDAARLDAFRETMAEEGYTVSTACFDMMDFAAVRVFFGGLNRLDVLAVSYTHLTLPTKRIV